ncbi:MAG: GNAT family N-acetyltransferase [Dysgonamonadaceae bacterium]|jgi:ribosomal protein S18 acetylase RimI-like enzyme|nr:GNAT family N-acetyltransferase [Dysgonamonadaceae bacterium]
MFSIRIATEKDAELIYSLALQVFPDTYKEMLSPEQSDYMLEWMYAPANTRRMISEGQVYLIMSKNGENCGYASVEQQAADLFHLHKIYVLPAFQGGGAGKFLFEAVLKYIRGIHPAPFTMELNVNRYNRAVHFYQHMGMTIDREGDFPIGNGYYMTDYIMKINAKGVG